MYLKLTKLIIPLVAFANIVQAQPGVDQATGELTKSEQLD